MPLIEVNVTWDGYLHLSAEVARRCFPNDALVVTAEDDALLLWPVRGVEAGGLLVKQRNKAGDRSVLIAESMPAGVAAGQKIAEWDEERAVLRLPLIVLNASSWRVPKNGVGVAGVVERESGRWAVYLEIASWEDDATGDPLRIRRHRIADYPTFEKAKIAAQWMERTADRSPTIDGAGA